MDRRKWLVVIAVDLAMFLAALDSTVVGTAMPTVVASLGGLGLFSWVFSIYLLAATVTMPIYGRLADLYGRRRILLIAIALFLAGAGTCAAARTMTQLILARVLQGLGAGGLMPVALIVTGDLFSLRERARIQGLFSSVWGVASLAGPHTDYETLPGAPYQYRELLGCIWRESLQGKLPPGERAMTMAALLHRDRQGTPVLAALVERSGLAAEAWLAELFEAVLPPLLHMLYRYGTVFSPHGENAILVHRDGVPTRLAVKDFVDDVNVSDQPLPELRAALAPDVAEVLLAEPPEWLCQFLWAGLFVGHLRHLADLAEDHLGVGERRFWTMARAAVLGYQDRFPELADRFKSFDLLAPRFAKLCLNRNRLLTDGYADRPERPHAATFGTVRNALDEVAEP